MNEDDSSKAIGARQVDLPSPSPQDGLLVAPLRRSPRSLARGGSSLPVASSLPSNLVSLFTWQFFMSICRSLPVSVCLSQNMCKSIKIEYISLCLCFTWLFVYVVVCFFITFSSLSLHPGLSDCLPLPFFFFYPRPSSISVCLLDPVRFLESTHLSYFCPSAVLSTLSNIC